MIGIRKAIDERSPYVLRKQANSESFLVTGRAFTEHYEIDTSVARRYNAEMHDDSILAIALDDDFVAVGRNGSGRRKDTSS